MPNCLRKYRSERRTTIFRSRIFRRRYIRKIPQRAAFTWKWPTASSPNAKHDDTDMKKANIAHGVRMLAFLIDGGLSMLQLTIELSTAALLAHTAIALVAATAALIALVAASAFFLFLNLLVRLRFKLFLDRL